MQTSSEVESLRQKLKLAENRIVGLELSLKTHRECINAQADQIDRLLKEVFGEDPQEVLK